MAATYILARTFREAHLFAKDVLGLDAGYYRVVNSVGTLKAVRGADLHLVPGWRRRSDRFAFESALRWTRMNVIDVELQQAEEPAAPAPAEPVQTPESEHPENGDDVPVSPDDATAFVLELHLPADVDAPLDEPEPKTDDASEAPTPEPEVAEEKPKKNRRRSRCKECGNLHFKEDPCPESDD